MTSPEQLKRLDYFYHVARLVIAVISGCGNSLTLVAIVKYNFLHTATNVIIFNLALADVLTSCFHSTLLAAVQYSSDKQVFHNGLVVNTDIDVHQIIKVSTENTTKLNNDSNVELSFAWDKFNRWRNLCLAKEMVTLYILGVAQLTIFLLTVDRFIFIQKPLHYYNIMSTKKAIWLCVLLWTLMILIGPLVQPFVTEIQPGGQCDVTMFNKYYFIGVLVPIMGILTIVNVALYFTIAYVAVKQAKQIAGVVPINGSRGNAVDKKILKQNKVTRMLGITLGLYFACYIPSLVFSSIKSESLIMQVLRDLGFLAWFR